MAQCWRKVQIQRQRIRVETPIGGIGAIFNDDTLCSIELLPEQSESNTLIVDHPFVAQIQAYFRNPKVSFQQNLQLTGTPFQRRVWLALQQIPVGSTMTYGQLARRLNSGARAVANACRRNPVPLLVPCHRVVGASGLGGFMGEISGEKLDIKRWLLRHEGVHL